MANNFVSVAIDGPAGAGKSTVATKVAKLLNFRNLNSGELYRAVGLKYLKEKSPLLDTDNQIKKFISTMNISVQYIDNEQRTFSNGEDVTALLHTNGVSYAASIVSPILEIRKEIIKIQRNICETHNVVIDGRDIGTTVIPYATFKFYLTASIEVRAKRRLLELLQSDDKSATYEKVVADINERDYSDSQRQFGAMKRADDAILIDTTNKSIDEVAEIIVAIVRGN